MHADILTRDEVKSAVAREGCRRPPLMLRMWIGQDWYDAYGDALRELVNSVPEDVVQVGFRAPAGWEYPADLPDYRWAIFDKPEDEDTRAIDARRFLPGWDNLGEFLSGCIPAGTSRRSSKTSSRWGWTCCTRSSPSRYIPGPRLSGTAAALPSCRG